MPIRVLRWIVLHVFFASVPILAPLAVYRLVLKPPQDAQFHAGEVLFFTFMVSSIACGEVAELIFRYRVSFLLPILAVWFLFGALWSSSLYAMSVEYNIVAHTVGAGSTWQTILAVVFLVLGTVAVIIHDLVESGKWKVQLR
jgi:hypothetical protein